MQINLTITNLSVLEEYLFFKSMDLPTDIVTNIFSRLPLNSITPLPEVFPDTVLQPDFQRFYFHSHPLTFLAFNPSTKLHQILEYHHDLHHPIVSTNLSLLHLLSTNNETPLCNDFAILASCNGLILGRVMHKHAQGLVSESLSLVNPLTRRCLILTAGPPDLMGLIKYGLGYSSLTKLYKVVQFDTSVCASKTGITKVLTVDLTNNKYLWREVDGNKKGLIPGFIQYLESPVALRRVIHWLIGTKNLILRFDVDVEEFDIVSMPYKAESSSYVMSQLSVVGGSLCALANHVSWNDKGCVEVWVKKEYEVEDSWTRLAVLCIPEFDYSMMRELNLIHILKDGKLLIKLKNEICVYDPVQGKWEDKGERETMEQEIKYFEPSFLSLTPYKTSVMC